ncbi:MFS transporter [Actinospica robiniae]|uniref:MFS transporter n=1 Tax=Actinospica robiniae TaxID=304901 RepID=UPI00042764E0|nr:MFS transporter [Actinospica robiniae]
MTANPSDVLSRLAETPLAHALRTERARPRQIRELPNGWWLAVATVCFGAFMGQLDASIATLTYGALRGRFHASDAAVSWVSLGYMLVLVALLVPVGRFSDAHGRKLCYLYGFLVFTAASAACGLAPTLAALIAFRLVQAFGAALLQANSVALVTTSAPRTRMRAALGVQAGAQALGLALGPALGGLLVSTLGWRWVFLVNVPVGVFAVVAGHYLLPRTRTKASTAGFDWPGLALLAVSSTALLLGISAASGLGLPGIATAGAFVVAAVAGYCFWRRINGARLPLIDPILLRTRQISAGLVGALGGYLVLFGPLVLVPDVLGAAHGAARAGLVLTALPLGFAAGALGANRVLPAGWTDRRRALIGSAVAAAALAALIPLPFDPAALIPLYAILGLGLGTFTPANNTLVMGAIPARAAGTGGGLVNMTRGLGTALGVALVTLTLYLVPDPARAAHAATAVLAVVAVGVFASNLLHPRAAGRGEAGPLEL